MSWHDKRYSPWLLKHEEQLKLRQDSMQRIVIILGLLIAVAEALLPWGSITPDIPAWVHIAVAALVLPVLYLMWQNDFRRKQQAFSVAMSDRGRRLLFLDPFLDPEEFEVNERLQGAHLLPLQRSIDATLKAGAQQSLHARVAFYFRTLPHPVFEGDRMGALSFLHPGTMVSWGAALLVNWAFIAQFGQQIGTSHGLSVLTLLLLLYLFACRLNSRFAFEHALYDWLRLG